MNPMICVFMPWWGEPPGWEAEFLERASHSKRIQVILVGDAARFAPGKDLPRIPCSMEEFEDRAGETVGLRVRKRDPRYFRGQAICELRCMLAEMYPAVTAPFPWWGWGDWDVVWGDWDSFLTDERLAGYDMITSNCYTVNGPFVIFRNAPAFNGLYRKRIDKIASPDATYMDEAGLEAIVREEMERGRMRCLYPIGINAHDRDPVWNRCALVDGILYKMDAAGRLGGEIMKFHFPRRKKWPVEDCGPLIEDFAAYGV